MKIFTRIRVIKGQRKNRIFNHKYERARESSYTKKYDQAFDLADALHMYPEIVANNLKKFPKSYWKLIYNPYKKKWIK